VDLNDLRRHLAQAAENPTLFRNTLITIALWVVAILIRQVVASYLRRRGLAPTELRRMMATSRNVVVLGLVVASITVWFDELRTFAVSLVAVAAAIVIATKELIMGAGGTFLRTSARIFDIGDRIEVNGLRGDVIDTTLFTTTILEIGPGRIGHTQTGRSVTIPNALLLTNPIINESFSNPFIVHTFEVPAPRDAVLEAEAALRAACDEVIGPVVDDARRYFQERLNSRGLEMPHIEPRILVRLDDVNSATLVVTLVAPARRKGYIEQEIIHGFIARRLAPSGAHPQAAAVINDGDDGDAVPG
jgi:small-conductance mechanosensitive channel